MRTDRHDNKILIFATQIMNAYRDEEEREYTQPLELTSEELTDDFIAMLQAMNVNYVRITGDNLDLIGFTHLLNRLAFQHLLENNAKANDDECYYEDEDEE